MKVLDLVRRNKRDGKIVKTLDLSRFGIETTDMAYAGAKVLKPTKTGDFALTNIKWARPYDYLALDIEEAGWQVGLDRDDRRATSIQNWLKLLKDVHHVFPDSQVGLFGTAVFGRRGQFRNMYPDGATTVNRSALSSWRWLNADTHILRTACDYLAPVCYAFTESKRAQYWWMRRLVDLAREHDRPVYPWVSPFQWCPLERMVPRGWWRWLLETLQKLGVDGVIVWTPGGFKPTGDEPWIQVLREMQ